MIGEAPLFLGKKPFLGKDLAHAQKFETAPVVRPWDGPLPEIISRQSEFYYVHHEGVRLRVMLAKTPAEDPRGSIIFHPGRTEFIEKYFETVENFLTRGFNVLIFDPRAQGLSDRLLEDPMKMYVRHFQDYADDFAYVTEQFAADLPKPHIAVGHSMGGCIILLAVLTGVTSPSAVVCCAPMTGIFDVETRLSEFVIKGFNVLGFAKRNIPFQKQNNGLPVPFKDNKLTSDIGRFQRWATYLNTTPELRVGSPTVSWVRQALWAMNYINRNARQLKIPGLIIAAGGDPIVDPASNSKFAHMARIDYKVIPGALHEMLMETDEIRNQLFESIDQFFEKEGF